jgi:hypothetical protein
MEKGSFGAGGGAGDGRTRRGSQKKRERGGRGEVGGGRVWSKAFGSRGGLAGGSGLGGWGMGAPLRARALAGDKGRDKCGLREAG